MIRSSRPLRLPRLAGVVAAAAALVLCVPTMARACALSTAPESNPFVLDADLSSYLPVPDGLFTGSTAGWTFHDASVLSSSPVTGILNPPDSSSLLINPGGYAISPPICVGLLDPIFRFVARTASGVLSTLSLSLLWTNSRGVQEVSPAGWDDTTPLWSLGIPQGLSLALPLTAVLSTMPVQLELSDAVEPAEIGDLYYDPYGRS